MSSATEFAAAVADAVPAEKRAVKKRFRPIRSSVRVIMGRVGEPGAIRRSDTLDRQEDLAQLVLKKVSQRVGTFVQSGNRSKITKKDVMAAVKLEFGDAFASKALEFADSVLRKVE